MKNKIFGEKIEQILGLESLPEKAMKTVREKRVYKLYSKQSVGRNER
ncbi:MAG: hypothetical protein ACUVT9_03600 [Candidatus Bathycorpusculaceae bacterium]